MLRYMFAKYAMGIVHCVEPANSRFVTGNWRVADSKNHSAFQLRLNIRPRFFSGKPISNVLVLCLKYSSTSKRGVRASRPPIFCSCAGETPTLPEFEFAGLEEALHQLSLSHSVRRSPSVARIRFARSSSSYRFRDSMSLGSNNEPTKPTPAAPAFRMSAKFCSVTPLVGKIRK